MSTVPRNTQLSPPWSANGNWYSALSYGPGRTSYNTNHLIGFLAKAADGAGTPVGANQLFRIPRSQQWTFFGSPTNGEVYRLNPRGYVGPVQQSLSCNKVGFGIWIGTERAEPYSRTPFAISEPSSDDILGQSIDDIVLFYNNELARLNAWHDDAIDELNEWIVLDGDYASTMADTSAPCSMYWPYFNSEDSQSSVNGQGVTMPTPSMVLVDATELKRHEPYKSMATTLRLDFNILKLDLQLARETFINDFQNLQIEALIALEPEYELNDALLLSSGITDSNILEWYRSVAYFDNNLDRRPYARTTDPDIEFTDAWPEVEDINLLTLTNLINNKWDALMVTVESVLLSGDSNSEVDDNYQRVSYADVAYYAVDDIKQSLRVKTELKYPGQFTSITLDNIFDSLSDNLPASSGDFDLTDDQESFYDSLQAYASQFDTTPRGGIIWVPDPFKANVIALNPTFEDIGSIITPVKWKGLTNDQAFAATYKQIISATPDLLNAMIEGRWFVISGNPMLCMQVASTARQHRFPLIIDFYSQSEIANAVESFVFEKYRRGFNVGTNQTPDFVELYKGIWNMIEGENPVAPYSYHSVYSGDYSSINQGG
jgi:hypothetical protein